MERFTKRRCDWPDRILIGAGWAVAVGFIAGAIIAEILSRIGQYKNFWLNTIGYSIYMTFLL